MKRKCFGNSFTELAVTCNDIVTTKSKQKINYNFDDSFANLTVVNMFMSSLPLSIIRFNHPKNKILSKYMKSFQIIMWFFLTNFQAYYICYSNFTPTLGWTNIS
jgi:hypothetical protein